MVGFNNCEQDIFDNIETAFTSALYTYLRALYNNKELSKLQPELATALFVFLRNYAYSGMFRYNDNGDFNVPYGGISYNHKTMRSKVDYYQSPELLVHFGKTTIESIDFLDFFHKHRPTEKVLSSLTRLMIQNFLHTPKTNSRGMTKSVWLIICAKNVRQNGR